MPAIIKSCHPPLHPFLHSQGEHNLTHSKTSADIREKGVASVTGAEFGRALIEENKQIKPIKEQKSENKEKKKEKKNLKIIEHSEFLVPKVERIMCQMHRKALMAKNKS
jgi:hypothetical protein